MLSRVLLGISVMVVQTIGLMLMNWLLPGLTVVDWRAAFLAVLVIALLNVVFWPLFISMVERFNLIIFLVLTIVLNGASVYLTSLLVPGVTVDGLWTAFWVTLGLTAVTSIFTTVFAFHDADYYTKASIRRISRATNGTPDTTPGVIFAQIDGLSEPVLRIALEQGYVPTIKRWLERGSHRLVGWEANLPCQTSASQAGILHGSNVNIPAFRWLEKETGKILVSNHPKDAAEIESRLTNGQGLLAGGGVGRGNIFSGDAGTVMLTFSTVLNKSTQRSADYAAYLSSPMNLGRTLVLMFWDIVLETTARLRAKFGHVEPHGHRSFPYILVRAFTTVFLRDVVVYSLIGDMFRGVPAAYSDFVGYDEVSHHSGVLAPDALAVLKRIDHQLDRLERAAASAPRPYHIVLLSDHGQTQGATFKQRYDKTLGDVVNELIDSATAVEDISEGADTYGYLNAFLMETAQDGDSGAGRLARTAAGSHNSEGVAQYGPETTEKTAAPVTALASGNLGLVYFSELSGRATYEDIMAKYPRVIPGLVAHEGIGFVMVRSAAHGPLVLGRAGTITLATDELVGEDPLANFGTHARDHLRRLDSFNNTPDLLVNSFYDPVKDEAAAFEELIGGHGGLGGKQMHPFLIYPAAFPVDTTEEIIGAEHLHQVLKTFLPPRPAEA
jgi:uncharacterized membrane protein YvlD (DUF360 family)